MAKYKLKIDPGHGGKDPGAISSFGNEEDWTLKISLYQYNRFKELGVSVSLTRDSDETLTEDQRVALAQEGEYCISNHLNAGGGDRAEVIHSIYDDGKLANAIKYQLESAGQTNVKVYCKQGKSGDYYYMHRRTGKTKTNIVEYCFIDNEADFTHFKNNWEAYAEATVKAFCSHIGHPYRTKDIQKSTVTVTQSEILYIQTGGYAGPALQTIHDYLFETGHGFDVKRGGDGSIVFLIGPFDNTKPNFQECRVSVSRIDGHMQLLTQEQASKWR
ncbi:N-acetylmuramoyl-L-alanine amidase [Neobacillus sp. 3P2-tot-E-2]|uniref:N-acetylmuramoyl-L-alanine amidase family protein n=1 Tax=Neobacillus sp. 3P2-tot-E-2 TaxID=3132212 RepID=UPI0039A3E822